MLGVSAGAMACVRGVFVLHVYIRADWFVPCLFDLPVMICWEVQLSSKHKEFR